MEWSSSDGTVVVVGCEAVREVGSIWEAGTEGGESARR